MQSYIPCVGIDPANATAADVIAIARSDKEVLIHCAGGREGGVASARLGHFSATGSEELSFDRTNLDEILSAVGRPLCSPNDLPITCRYPHWPYARFAGTIWHEAAHNWGFSHIDTEYQSCGNA